MTDYKMIIEKSRFALWYVKQTNPRLSYYLAKNLYKLRALESNGYYDECLKILDEFQSNGIEISPVYYQKFVDLKEGTKNEYC